MCINPASSPLRAKVTQIHTFCVNSTAYEIRRDTLVGDYGCAFTSLWANITL
jgi:hypothetical protein